MPSVPPRPAPSTAAHPHPHRDRGRLARAARTARTVVPAVLLAGLLLQPGAASASQPLPEGAGRTVAAARTLAAHRPEAPTSKSRAAPPTTTSPTTASPTTASPTTGSPTTATRATTTRATRTAATRRGPTRAAAVTGVASGVTTVAAAAAVTPPPGPPATAGIEGLAGYVPDLSCDAVTKPGTSRLAGLLTSTWVGTSAGTARDCGTDGSVSEHYDGRAVDWMTSVRTAAGAERANELLTWLFATDSRGNTFADARRLGVMYVIWNGAIWGAYRPSDGWRPYSSCASHPETAWDTTCHRDHVHLSLSWEGAMGRTSYWTGGPAARDYGPCRVPDLTWAPPYIAARTTPCPSSPAVPVQVGASALLQQLVAASGALLRPGSAGAPVAAVNSLLGVAGSTWTADTTARLRSYQAARGLPQTAVTDVATWRAVTGASVAAASVPVGHLDGGGAVGTAALSVSGWGFDGESDATLSVRVTVDGVATTAPADTSRPDVAASYPTRSAAHGFAVTRPVAPGVHRVCVDLLNLGLGHDVALGCLAVTVPAPEVVVTPRSHPKTAVGVRVGP